MNNLSTVVNTLTQDGYTESFIAKENCIRGSYSKKEYQPEDLEIIKSYRFDGMTNPADESQVLAIKTNDGVKGTLVLSYSAKHNNNSDLIRRIEKQEKPS